MILWMNSDYILKITFTVWLLQSQSICKLLGIVRHISTLLRVVMTCGNDVYWIQFWNYNLRIVHCQLPYLVCIFHLTVSTHVLSYWQSDPQNYENTIRTDLHFNPIMPCAVHARQSTWPWKCIYVSEGARLWGWEGVDLWNSPLGLTVCPWMRFCIVCRVCKSHLSTTCNLELCFAFAYNFMAWCQPK